MEEYIQISKINDFTFCPKSIYLHRLYEDYDYKMIHRLSQTEGKLNHENIDQGHYSTAKKYHQGLYVSSERLGLVGKIDIYDTKAKALIERKTKIKKIYPGFKYQLYAQKFCLEEMGYEVKKLFIHSLKDNKRYEIPLPNKNEKQKFMKVLEEMRSFDMEKYADHRCSRCSDSIYGNLSW